MICNGAALVKDIDYTVAYQRAFGIAYAKGVLKTLNIPYKAP